ncbi:MAG: sodium:proton antiporter [Ktedonobacteraceae bacterium]|nr:sodium:proton antiporter [Chloroflexota bacterium]
MIDIVSVVRTFIILLLIALVVIIVARRLAIPYTLGLVIVGLAISLFVNLQGVRLTPDLVLFVFLPALLFEGAFASSVRHLREHWLPVLTFAIPGVLLTLIIIALPFHFLIGLDWATALLLGAILAPTDPIAVLGLFRQLKASPDLSAIIEGESLFNDGVAGSLYQIFLALIVASAQGHAETGAVLWFHGIGTFLLEAGGGCVVGLLCSFLVSRALKFVDEPLFETIVTIVTAYGSYLLADALHVSGIIAVVVAGLVIGSYGRSIGLSEQTREIVDAFWSVLGFLANALIFLLVGLELNPVKFLTFPGLNSILANAGLAICAVLIARLLMVYLLPRAWTSVKVRSLPLWRVTLFWSGLRGALSLALVLALPLEVPKREVLLISTYAVILFTLLVQGLSIRVIIQQASVRTPEVSQEDATP